MVLTGLDVLLAEGLAFLKGKRLGVVTHHAAVDRRLRHPVDLLVAAPGIAVVRLFGPRVRRSWRPPDRHAPIAVGT